MKTGRQLKGDRWTQGDSNKDGDTAIDGNRERGRQNDSEQGGRELHEDSMIEGDIEEIKSQSDIQR